VDPQTIDQVIAQLDAVVSWSYDQASPLGFFAAMYRTVTHQIDASLQARRFADPDRIERLDVVFASRYLDAFGAHQRNEPTTQAWTVAFEAAEQRNVVLMQHLLLGMNAHIRLDLGVSTAAVAGDAPLDELHHDFLEVNSVLGQVLPQERDAIERVSPGVRLLDRCRWADQRIATLWLEEQRDDAWRVAQRLAGQSGAVLDAGIATTDAAATLKARELLKPDVVERMLERDVVEHLEDHDVRAVIEALSA
jgi:hypothetical protein